MSNNLENVTPNKIINFKLNSLKSTPKFSPFLPPRENNNSKLKIFNSMKNTLFSNSQKKFNSLSSLKNNSSDFLIPFSKSYLPNTNTKLKSNAYTQKKMPNSIKKSLLTNITNSTLKINKSNSFSEIKVQNIFLNKKRKHMTTEEIELEKIKREKEDIKKLMQKNKKSYLKSLNYSPMKIIPSPLTTFIPFNLSSNNNTKYIKQGKSSSTYEVNEQNHKIRLKMQQKIEKLSDNKIKGGILLNNSDYLKKQNELYNNLFNDKNDVNNTFSFIKDEDKNLNTNKKSIILFKDINCSKINQSQTKDSQNKKFKENYKISDFIKALRKNKAFN